MNNVNTSAEGQTTRPLCQPDIKPLMATFYASQSRQVPYSPFALLTPPELTSENIVRHSSLLSHIANYFSKEGHGHGAG